MRTEIRLVIFILALPTYVVVYAVKLVLIVWRARYALSTWVWCFHCDHEISLVGGWRCHCGYTYTGSVLRLCPVCHTRPVFVRCPGCGVTRKIR